MKPLKRKCRLVIFRGLQFEVYSLCPPYRGPAKRARGGGHRGVDAKGSTSSSRPRRGTYVRHSSQVVTRSSGSGESILGKVKCVLVSVPANLGEEGSPSPMTSRLKSEKKGGGHRRGAGARPYTLHFVRAPPGVFMRGSWPGLHTLLRGEG